MPISVSCQCGKAFQAKDELAGKLVKCPGCGNGLQIPQPAQAAPQGGMGDLLSEAGMNQLGPTCPSCSSSVQAGAVICVNCGYNIQTGQQLKTRTASGLGPGASETDKMLAKAAVELEKEPIRQDEGYGSASGAWMTFLIMFVGLGVALGIGFAVFKWIDVGGNARATQVMFVFGQIIATIGGVWVLVAAFRESVVQGILCLVIPLYILLYMILNFDDVTVPTILWCVGTVMVGVSYLMAGLASDESSYIMNAVFMC